MADRDRPKRSWREIDSARGSQRSSSDGPRDPNANSNSHSELKASRAHRAALDALFERGELGKYADKLGLAPPGTKPASSEAAKAPAPPPPDPAAEARAELEAEKAQLRKKILEGTSRDAVARSFDRYAKAYGMPKDWELLERGLEHPEDDRLAEVMGEIEGLLSREKPRRARTLDGRLRFIAETHEDGGLRDRAAAIRTRL